MTTVVRTVLPDAPALQDTDLWTKIRQRYTRYWEAESGLWAKSTFLGVPIEKFPTDAWMYQELIARVRPDVLVETGTLAGGSAFFFARIMDMIGHGEVVSVDIASWPSPYRPDLAERFNFYQRPEHPRISYLTGGSTDLGIFAQVQARCEGKRVLVILDSDHSARHVRAELEIYPALVSVGSYLVVEDTGLSGATNPGQDAGFGAYEGLASWLPDHPEFEPDLACERFLITAHPGGWLKRVR